ncbi:MAG: penicillin amidase [Solirubrobacterales bacterium]|nr:penicillin amidase [Solirubrobacterales bacterium]
MAGTLAALGGVWYQLLRRPLPKTRGTLRVEGPEGPIEISRDRHAVPHVRAQSERDVWFGQGFCIGQERLWQMDFYRRAASGRLSEIAGEQTLRTDRFMRTLGLRRVAEREAEELDADLRRLMQAYCDGVNAAAAAAGALPIEFQLLRIDFQPWRPVDMLTVTKLLGFGLSTNWERELLRAEMARELGEELAERLEPRYPRGNPVVLEPGEGYSGDGLSIVEQIDAVKRDLGLALEASGSNNWAVSGERSATGTPLIAGDPHLSPSMPGIWFQISLQLGDRWVRGCAPPGLPGIYLGQNNDVAWTFTNVMADVMDLFVERIEGDEYEFEGERRPLQVIAEEIRVKGRDEPELLEVRATHHGPIVNDFLGADDEQPLALRWSAWDNPGVTASQFAVLDVASGPEFVAAVSDFALPVSNLVWADRHGDIGYKLMGRLPRRRGGCPDLPKPGWTGEHEWDGYVAYEEMPELTNPDAGYVVTANNRIVGDDFPHHITSDYLDGYRAARIEQLIRSRPVHDVEDFEAMQSDLLSIPGLETAQRLHRLAPRDQREVSALERLASWDGRMDADSIGATIYQAFVLRLAHDFTRAAIGDRDLSERWLDRADNAFMAHVTSPWRWQARLMELWDEGDEELIGRPWDELALDALRGGLDYLEDRFGADPDCWRWGHVHEMEFPHALGSVNPLFSALFNRRLEAGGAQETVCQIAYDPNGPFRAVWAPSWRMVADLGDPSRSRWQAFTGQSGHPGSNHYDDLQAPWLAGRTQAMAGEAPWKTLTLMPA